jgi:hypothetical protein
MMGKKEAGSQRQCEAANSFLTMPGNEAISPNFVVNSRLSMSFRSRQLTTDTALVLLLV